MADVRLTATNPLDSSVVPVACNEKGELKLEEPSSPPEFDGNLDGDLTVSGKATFSSDVDIATAGLTRAGIRNLHDGCIQIRNDNGTNNGLEIFYNGNSGPAKVTQLGNDGRIRVAGGAAGFTADGHLYCTTERGQLVILNNVANGIGYWENYIPTNRLDEIKDQLIQTTDIDDLKQTRD